MLGPLDFLRDRHRDPGVGLRYLPTGEGFRQNGKAFLWFKIPHNRQFPVLGTQVFLVERFHLGIGDRFQALDGLLHGGDIANVILRIGAQLPLQQARSQCTGLGFHLLHHREALTLGDLELFRRKQRLAQHLPQQAQNLGERIPLCLYRETHGTDPTATAGASASPPSPSPTA